MTAEKVYIWHQSIAEMSVTPNYKESLSRRSAEVLGPRFQVDIMGLPSGSYGDVAPGDILAYPYLSNALLAQMVEAAREAEKAQYDAFVVGSFSDPFLREIRSSVSIPVVSTLESAVLFGTILGLQLSLIANSPAVARIVRQRVNSLGIEKRVSSIRYLSPSRLEPELESALACKTGIPEDFVAICKEEIERGTDVFIPAEGILNELVQSEGLATVDGAAVIDSFACAWSFAGMMVQAQRRGHRIAGRVSSYPLPPSELVRRLARAAQNWKRFGGP